MVVIQQSAEILDELDEDLIYKKLESIGRVCYKSESLIEKETAAKFLRAIVRRGHESVLEHVSFSVRFVTDRATANQIVRHRLASFSQESQRYVNYNKKTLEFVNVPALKGDQIIEQLDKVEKLYSYLIEHRDMKPEQARAILPNCTKTEIVMTANVREWRHFLKLRTDSHAQRPIRDLSRGLLLDLQDALPVLFDDINIERN